jgi:hypothetical protein
VPPPSSLHADGPLSATLATQAGRPTEGRDMISIKPYQSRFISR